MNRLQALTLMAGLLAGCSAPDSPSIETADLAAIEAATHGAYNAAINSNDTDTLMAVLADDIVFQAPGEAEVIGKDAVRDWVDGYFAAFETRYDKTSIDFRLSGETAIDRYTYTVTDTNRETGEVSTGQGKGLAIFELGDDGDWHLALDGWSTTAAAPAATLNEDITGVLERRTETILTAVETGDMAPVLDLFTEDAVYSPSGDSLITDRAGLTAYWNEVAQSPAADGMLEAVEIEWLAPDAFLEIQRYEVFDETGARLFGGYASILWRKVDGRWLIASDISND